MLHDPYQLPRSQTSGRAGQLRTVLIVKAGASFCLPHRITETATDVFGRLAAADHLRGRDRTGFLDGLTPLLAEVNALHPSRRAEAGGHPSRRAVARSGFGLSPPIREGNGRTQRAFLSQLAVEAGFRLRWAAVDRDANIDAARAAADGDLGPLRALLAPVVQVARRGAVDRTPPR